MPFASGLTRLTFEVFSDQEKIGRRAGFVLPEIVRLLMGYPAKTAEACAVVSGPPSLGREAGKESMREVRLFDGLRGWFHYTRRQGGLPTVRAQRLPTLFALNRRVRSIQVSGGPTRRGSFRAGHGRLLDTCALRRPLTERTTAAFRGAREVVHAG